MANKYKRHKRFPKGLVIGIMIAVVLIVAVGSIFLIKLLLAGSSAAPHRQIQKITLLKPPKPPKIKEKPPEPKQKKEKVIEQQKAAPKPQKVKADNKPPPGKELGLDAKGSGSGDAFGLKARKGGRSLIGGGGTGYGWYTRRIAEELQQLVNRLLRGKAGFNGKDLKTEIRIKLDEAGRIADFTITGPSGNRELDDAVRQAVKKAQLSDPPPYGMSRVLKFRIRPKG
ncbi:TonB family protein [Desulfobacterota bacterium M19]